MSDLFGHRRRIEQEDRDDLGRRLTTAQVAAQIASAADQLQAAFRSIEPNLTALQQTPPPTTKDVR